MFNNSLKFSECLKYFKIEKDHRYLLGETFKKIHGGFIYTFDFKSSLSSKKSKRAYSSTFSTSQSSLIFTQFHQHKDACGLPLVLGTPRNEVLKQVCGWMDPGNWSLLEKQFSSDLRMLTQQSATFSVFHYDC